jgi:cysteine desulfurase
LQPLYLDHAATTPVRSEVREAMEPYLTDTFGNPSSAHAWGRRASAALEEARARAAAALGARPSEIYFVRGGTESDNLAILGRAAAVFALGGRPLVVHSTIEHKAVLEAAEAAAESGGGARSIDVDRRGHLQMDELDRALEQDPAVVSVMWVNNETGTVLNIAEVAGLARSRGAVVHTDAVQAVGKVPVSVAGDSAPDLLTVTGHKIYGPKGTGILYVRDGVALAPLLFGGGQEKGLRPGTQDVAGAWGMARALELAVEEQPAEAVRLAGLRDQLEASLLSRIDGLVVHGSEGERAPHVSNLGIPGADQEALLAALDLEGIAVSSGSACNSGVTRASHVLRALYGHAADQRATVRFSLGRATTEADVSRAADTTADVVARLRAHSASAGAGARAQEEQRR